MLRSLSSRLLYFPHLYALQNLIQAATAYGAVFLFAVRDLAGMLGSLVFAHMEVSVELVGSSGTSYWGVRVECLIFFH